MKRTTVRDLRYHFREIEARLNKGEEIELRRIFGTKRARKTGTDLVSEERGLY